MAQEFASNNSKQGIFARLNHSNHRGFFSFIFVTLSVIFILITFAAVQQQQTTQSKAAEINLCSKAPCEEIKIPVTGPLKNRMISICNTNYAQCCIAKETKLNSVLSTWSCNQNTSVVRHCSDIKNVILCSAIAVRPYCEWNNNACVDKVKITPTPACKNLGERCGSTAPCCGTNKCLSNGVGSETICKVAPTSTPTNLCTKVNCSALGEVSCSKTNPCCEFNKSNNKCEPKLGGTFNCSGLSSKVLCTALGWNPYCEWDDNTGCVEKNSGGGSSSTTIYSPRTSCFSNTGVCLKKTGTPPENGEACGYEGKTGTFKKGDCPGGTDVVCCVTDSSGGGGGITPIITEPPIVTQTPTDTPTPTPGETADVELNLKIAYHGLVSLPKTTKQLNFKVKLVDAVNKTKENDSSVFTADNSGIWSGTVTFNDIDLSQKYYILIKGPMHIQKKICEENAVDPNPGYYSCQFGNITLKSGVNNFDYSKVKMLVGDLKNPTQNGVIDSEDLAIIKNAIRLSFEERHSADVLEKADLNLDGEVSTQDWALMIEAMEIKYDDK